MNVPIEAVLAELMQERLFVRWLERQPDRVFGYAPEALTPLGIYLAEQGGLPETDLHGLVLPTDAAWIWLLHGVFATREIYTAQDVIDVLRKGHL